MTAAPLSMPPVSAGWAGGASAGSVHPVSSVRWTATPVLPALYRAAGRAGSWAPPPATVTEYLAYLGGGGAGALGDRRPVVPQRLLPGRGRGVVPGRVLPPVLLRVRQPPVELHHHAVPGVHAVPAAAAAVLRGERDLPVRLGQAVSPFDVPVVAELQHRMVTGDGCLEDLVQVRAPAQPWPFLHGCLQLRLVGELARDSAGHPAADVIKAFRRLRQIKHRLLNRGTRWIARYLHRLDVPGRPMQADALGRLDASRVWNHHVYQPVPLVGEPMQFRCGLIAQDSARADRKHSRPEP